MGAAIAAYGATAGISVNIVAPSNASSKIAQIKSYGAKIHLIPGTREYGTNCLGDGKKYFYASHNWHPFFYKEQKHWVMNCGKTWLPCT